MNFSLTIQIPSFKKICHNDIYQNYSKFLCQQQKEIILNRLAEAIDFHKPANLDYVIYFEEHKDKRIHAHIYMKHITISDMNNLQNHFCCSFGIKKSEQQKQIFYFDILQTELDCSRWLDYCLKNQNI